MIRLGWLALGGILLNIALYFAGADVLAPRGIGHALQHSRSILASILRDTVGFHIHRQRKIEDHGREHRKIEWFYRASATGLSSPLWLRPS